MAAAIATLCGERSVNRDAGQRSKRTFVQESERVSSSLPAVDADVPGRAAGLVDREVEFVNGVDVEVIEIETRRHSTLLHIQITIARACLNNGEHHRVDAVEREVVIIPAALRDKTVHGYADLQTADHSFAEGAGEAWIALAGSSSRRAGAMAAAAIADKRTTRDLERIGAGCEAIDASIPRARLSSGGNDNFRDATLRVVGVVPDEKSGICVVLDVQIAIFGARLSSFA